MVLANLADGLVGWLLLLAGVGKFTLWGGFRRSLTDAAVLPRHLATALGWAAPVLETLAGLWMLLRPSAWGMVLAALLYGVFALYQWRLARSSKPAGCACYGRLRQTRAGWPAVAGNSGFALLAVVLVFLPLPGDGWVARGLGGACLAALYLWAIGASQPHPRFVFAEVRYLEERAQGKSDREARAAVAQEFGLSEQSSYLLIPKGRAAVLLLRKRLGLKTTL